MTREEAINILNGDNLNRCAQKEREALDMAIKALSQMSEIEENIIKYMKKYPNHVGNIDFWEGFYACRNVVLQLDDEEYTPKEQEPCIDAVSREDAIEAVKQAIYNHDSAIMRLTELPSVTQKSGKWTLMYEPKNMAVCSECGKCAYMYQDKTSAFCPNCGAKMFEPQESEEQTE